MNESIEESGQEDSAEINTLSSRSTSLLDSDQLIEGNGMSNERSSRMQLQSEKASILASNTQNGWNPITVLTVVGVVIAAIGVVITILIFAIGDNILERAQEITTISLDQSQESEELNFQPSYAFNSPEFIHPRIINDMVGWISDGGNQITSINLNDSQDSNRYSGEISIEFEDNDSATPWIYWREKEIEGENGDSRLQYNGYKSIGSTGDGVQAIHFRTNGGAAIVRNFVLFLKIDIDRIFYYSHEGLSEDERIGVEPRYQIREILTLVGMIFLGDRWEGNIAISDEEVIVSGRDVYDRCVEGGSSENELFEFLLFDGIECEMSPAENAPQIYSYKIPPENLNLML